jgi:hypothetical protein
MNVGRYVLGSIIIFLFFYIMEWLFHGLILSGWYNEAGGLLRPDLEAGGLYWLMLLGLLILAFGFTFVFLKGYENKGVAEGFRYGLYVGLAFFVSTSLIGYGVFPLTAKILIAWIIGYPVIMILGGMIFAAVYKKKAA